MSADLACLPGERPGQVRARRRNGIEAVEVDRAARTLRILLLGKLARPGPAAANVRIDGPGRPVRAEQVELRGPAAASRRDELLVTLDLLGDASTYTVSLVELDAGGAPTKTPLRGFDPRASRADFTFTADCQGEADCAARPPCPPPERDAPALDYLAKDYASFRQLVLDRLTLTAPAWTDREVPDLGVTLVELLAYVGDQFSYAQDAVATEAYLGTARLRTSVRRHLRLVDYRMHDGCNARAWVHLEVDAPGVLRAGGYRFVTGVPALAGRAIVSVEQLRDVPPASYQVFEPLLARDLYLDPARNRIRLWTWGGQECCLPAGATSATLVDGWRDDDHEKRVLGLEPGDVVIFEEVRGPVTGVPGDADPGHRQAVRLTVVEEDEDVVYDQPLLRVRWAEEDALGFPLCIAAVGGEQCCLIEDVSVARGNVVLVDHGRTEPWCEGEPGQLTVPEAEPGPVRCDGLGRPQRTPAAVRFEPVLAAAPVTRRSPYPEPQATAAAQAWLLDQVQARAREELDRLIAQADRGEAPSDQDVTLARRLWGPRAAVEAGLAAEAEPASRRDTLRTLLARGPVALARRTGRLRLLAARARGGSALGADAAAEVAAAWGEQPAAGLDPAHPLVAGPASVALTQDPRAALAQLWLSSGGEAWAVRPDLLDSGPDDPHLVAEVDDAGATHLRFGDGRLGRAVEPGQRFAVRLRVGNGTAGNVGPEAVAHLVCCQPTDAAVVAVRNPLAATGGVDPEPVADARLLGPTAHRHQLLRAVTADDYAAVAAAAPGVQGAATDLAWTGSWYEADVAVDPSGRSEPPAGLLDAVLARLEKVRRIGHDLRVDPPRLVAVDVGLRVCLSAAARRAAVMAELRARLGDCVRPDGGLGLFHPDRLTFGTDLYASRIVAEAMAVPGVLTVSVVRLGRADAATPATPAGGALALGPLEIATGGGDPTRPAGGSLAIELVGGR